ncbi:MAG: hypothetical protein JWO92_100 [Chitinophagaceae bacterium]|nr:hypothetical protein [Chitinophagaceae bacterium]
MKRIIYTAVALIICASVFGIADYFNAKKQGTLVNYTDDVQTTEAVIPEKKNEITAVKEEIITDTKKEFKKDAKPAKKIAKTKVKDVHYTDIIPNLAITEKTKNPVIEKISLMDMLQAKTTDVNNDSTLQVDNKRRINMQMFSRAPIREKKLKTKK